MAPNTEPAMAPPQQPAQVSQAVGNLPPNSLTDPNLQSLQLNNLDQTQLMNLIRNLPGVFKIDPATGQPQPGNLKEDAAQTLSNLSQAAAASSFQLPIQYAPTGAGPSSSAPTSGSGLPGINDPGPSSHPRGPPNLGQLSAVAMQAAPAGDNQQQRDDQGHQQNGQPQGGDKPASPGTPGSTGGRARGGRSATMGSDEWSRQRKDNHKEVERRRRGNINEGINELGRIVPNGSGEKAKGAILSRAVQYIHHLKENEARNIEKWTLEKLLMDQAMGDLQAQLEEVKRLWEEERMQRTRIENELEMIRGMQGGGGSSSSNKKDGGEQTAKRRSEEAAEGADGEDREGKRPRTE